MCSKPEKNPVSPLESSMISWGKPLSVQQKKMESLGWVVLDASAQKSEYYLPAATSDRESGEVATALPYRIDLYAHDDRLAMVRMILRAPPERANPFLERMKQSYHLDAPAWEGEKSEDRTQTGNTLSDQNAIYETDELIVKVYRSRIQSSESKTDAIELDAQIFNKQLNEGLTVQRLAESR